MSTETTFSINGGKQVPLSHLTALNDALNRELRMSFKIANLIAEAVVEHIADAEQAAADAASDKDDEKPIIAKLGITVAWPAGAANPEIVIKCAYSVRRVIEVTALLDNPQSKLPLGDAPEVITADGRRITRGKISAKFSVEE